VGVGLEGGLSGGGGERLRLAHDGGHILWMRRRFDWAQSVVLPDGPATRGALTS
jgi:hypothetical protein